MRPSSASRIAATARNAIASVGRSSSANLTADSPRQIAATVIALGRMRRLTTGALTRRLDHGSSASTVSPADAPLAAAVDQQRRTRRAGRCPAASRTGSGRRCRRSSTLSPALTSQTMRRATRPAICTATTSTPSGVRISDAVALVVVAGRGAGRRSRTCPGGARRRPPHRRSGPAARARRSTDRKMLTRGSGVVGQAEFGAAAPPPRSGRSGRRRGRRPAPGRVGGTRGGWRKNAALAAGGGEAGAAQPAVPAARRRRPPG